MNKEKFTPSEISCLTNNLIFPELTKSILDKTIFKISQKDMSRLTNSIKTGYGVMINLNKELGLKLQYHGRFKSFLIGINTNPQNPKQPYLKLLRIESIAEETYHQEQMAFLGKINIKGPHFHWYNTLYSIFINQKTFKLEQPTKEIYNKIIDKFLKNNPSYGLKIDLLKRAVSYEIFIELYKLIINQGKKFREDGYITINKKLEKDPKKVLNQILNRELF